MVDYKSVFSVDKNIEKMNSMVYVFFGSSKIGKTMLANGVKNGIDKFKTMSIHEYTQQKLEQEIRSGYCVIVDNIKTKNDAVHFARFITNSGIRCVLVEFIVFA